MEKKLPVFNLEIIDDTDSDLEVDFVSLVDRPAIERAFLAFKDQFVEPTKGERKDEFIPRCIAYMINEGKDNEQAAGICYSVWEDHFAERSWNDYPEGAVNNAKRALAWVEKHGWGDCGEATGKIRANQIANREKLTRETIARISGFRRHQQNKDVPYSEGCGGLMWDCWGGDAMISWAENKLKKIDKQTFAIQDEDERIISGPVMLADTPIYRNDENGEYYVTFSKDTIKKIAQKFFKKGYQSNVNLMHDQGNLTEGLTMFESWIKDEKRGIKAMSGYEDTPDGSWFGSFKVDNEQVWQLIKEGKVRGFSVEGIFNYRKSGEKNYQEMWSKIVEILGQVK